MCCSIGFPLLKSDHKAWLKTCCALTGVVLIFGNMRIDNSILQGVWFSKTKRKA